MEALLLENNVDKRTVGTVKLLIEALYMLIAEKNEGKTVLSECTVFLRPKGDQIITKGDGVLFDISEEDVSVTSPVSFAVSSFCKTWAWTLCLANSNPRFTWKKREAVVKRGRIQIDR